MRGATRVLSAAAFAAVAQAAWLPAAAGGEFGLYPTADFVIGPGRADPQPPLRQAAWYFRDEIVAVPRAGLPLAGFERGVRAFDDVARWAEARPTDAAIDFPPLVWVAAPLQIRGARLAQDRHQLVTARGTLPWQLAPKIALNRSYADASTLAFFGGRELTLRGDTRQGAFVARSI